MKSIKYIALAMVCCLLATSCVDKDWDEHIPTSSNRGNDTLTVTNVVTIKQLKEDYKSFILNAYSLTQVTQDLKIQGRITGNDIGGNLYNEVSIDDGTGSILICISEGGLAGYLPVGQEILVDLKGLWIGNYGSQAEIGTPYTNSRGSTYVSRMSRILWNMHYKLLGTPDASQVVAVEFDRTKMTNSDYLFENSGKLMKLSNVKFTQGNGETEFAPRSERDAGNSVNRQLEGFNTTNLVVRTSSYADFAATKLPQGNVNLTGIFTRYRDTWQVLIRDVDDIEEIK